VVKGHEGSLGHAPCRGSSGALTRRAGLLLKSGTNSRPARTQSHNSLFVIIISTTAYIGGEAQGDTSLKIALPLPVTVQSKGPVSPCRTLAQGSAELGSTYGRNLVYSICLQNGMPISTRLIAVLIDRSRLFYAESLQVGFSWSEWIWSTGSPAAQRIT
jgi:hypothetical protein